MKKRSRLFGSLASFLNPSQIRSTKTGRASKRTCRKSLIINDQILHPHPNRPEMSAFHAHLSRTYPR